MTGAWSVLVWGDNHPKLTKCSGACKRVVISKTMKEQLGLVTVAFNGLHPVPIRQYAKRWVVRSTAVQQQQNTLLNSALREASDALHKWHTPTVFLWTAEFPHHDQFVGSPLLFFAERLRVLEATEEEKSLCENITVFEISMRSASDAGLLLSLNHHQDDGPFLRPISFSDERGEMLTLGPSFVFPCREILRRLLIPTFSKDLREWLTSSSTASGALPETAAPRQKPVSSPHDGCGRRTYSFGGILFQNFIWHLYEETRLQTRPTERCHPALKRELPA